MNAARARRRKLVALGVLTLAVLAVLSGLTWKIHSSTAAADQTSYPELTQAPPVNARPSVAFMGDSYSAGTGSSGFNARFTTLVAAYEGWEQNNFAYGGTGYLRSTSGKSSRTGCNSDACPRYGEVINSVKRANPNIVVVSGGRNDVGLPSSSVNEAIDAFYTSLREALPDARIIVTSPVWAYSKPPGQLEEIRSAVRAAAERVGATYLDIGEPLVDDRALVASDRVHPNNAGHAKLAQLTEVALSRAPQPSASAAA